MYNLSVDISTHPIWNQITPYKTRISSFKKPLHLAKIQLARQYVKLYPSKMFVGVTGSVGKTTCVTVANLVLSQKFKTITTKPNLDPILNIPSTILRLNPSVKKAIFEMGVEFKGEMDFYLSLIKPKTAIITKIHYAHSEFLGGIDEIIEEKGKLLRSLPKDGVAILNWDDIHSRKLASMTKAQIVYFGQNRDHCLLWADKIKVENYKTSFELNLGVERVKVDYQLLGEHQIYPALAAATLGVMGGLSIIQVKRGLEKVEPSEHRLQLVTGPRGSVILDDTYNSSPAAVEVAIDTLLQIPARRRVVVLGEMRELGKFSDEMHRQIARKIYKEKIDLVFLGTGDAQIIEDELKKLGFYEERVESNLQTNQIVSKLLKVLDKGDVCLIKGSRAVRLDEVVKRISKK